MRGVLLCILGASILALQMPLARMAYDAGSDPLSFALARSVLALPLILFISYWIGVSLAFPRRETRALIWVTMSQVVIGIGYLGAMAYVSPSLAGLVFYLFPFGVMAVAAIRARQWPKPIRILALIIAFSGLLIVFGPNLNTIDLRGVALALLATVGATFFFIVVPTVSQRLHGLQQVGWTNLMVALVFIPIIGVQGFHLPTGEIGWIAFFGAAACFAIGMVVTFAAVAAAGSEKASILFNLEPVTIILFSAVLLSERLSVLEYAGAAVVITGLVLASLPRRTPKTT